MPLPLHPPKLWFDLRFSDLELKHCRNQKMPGLCDLTMPLLFMHNFSWINFPPADSILAFLGLPRTFLGSLLASFPFVSMRSQSLVKQQWPVASSACCQQRTSHQADADSSRQAAVVPMFSKAHVLLPICTLFTDPCCFIPVEFLHFWFLWVLHFSTQRAEQEGEGLHSPWALCTK